MLAIHDIGEIEVGDLLTFDKTDTDAKKEFEIAKTLLHPTQISILEEYEDLKSLEAKFATSIDKFSALIIGLPLSNTELNRWKYYKFSLQQVIDDKKDIFDWDKILLEIFNAWIKKIKVLDPSLL